MNVKNKIIFIISLASLLLIQGCSNGNGFHLRNKITLANKYKSVTVQGLERDSQQFKALKLALQEASSFVVQYPDKALTTSTLQIKNLREGKRVVAYTSERKVREYLLFLKFDYSLINNKELNNKRMSNKNENNKEESANHDTNRINLDRAFLYDVSFVLGKTEEERQIRKTMYAEAARLILLKMQHGQ